MGCQNPFGHTARLYSWSNLKGVYVSGSLTRRDTKFTTSFAKIFASLGAETIVTSVPSVREDCLDHLLVLSRRGSRSTREHLETVYLPPPRREPRLAHIHFRARMKSIVGPFTFLGASKATQLRAP